MPLLSHKFHDHLIDPDTEILMIGTFNPNIEDGPDFFYGRPKNYLWHLLPQCYGLPSLKNASFEAKQEFMRDFRIDFADLIAVVDVPEGQEANVDDTYIDGSVEEWKEIIPIIESLPHLSAFFFTRISFGGVPNIRNGISGIRNHVLDRGLYFACLKTPARFANEPKPSFWHSRLIDREPCTAL